MMVPGSLPSPIMVLGSEPPLIQPGALAPPIIQVRPDCPIIQPELEPPIIVPPEYRLITDW
jgi:hypothetical protein